MDAGHLDSLHAMLPSAWFASASKSVTEYSTFVGGLSVRVKRRQGQGARWACTAWTKGPAGEGLRVAFFHAGTPVTALAGGLAQIEGVRNALDLRVLTEMY